MLKEDRDPSTARTDPEPPTPLADPLPDGSPSFVGRTLGGRYRVQGLLGRGGMGAVYEAVDEQGKVVAVKVILGEDASSRQRFVREAREASSIHSKHVVALLAAEVDGDAEVPFIVMERLSGTNLDQLIRRVGPLEVQVVARIFLQACRGISAAHLAAIVHRDIKPANIFLDTSGGEVTVKICDFGIARSVRVSATDDTSLALTRSNSMVGTPLYASPEQVKDSKRSDFRSDIWSLCITLYEALSGETPWSHRTGVEVISAILGEEPSLLNEIAPWVDPRLARVVQRGLHKDPRKRWHGIDELETELRPFAGGSERVSVEMLTGLPPDQRARSASRPAPVGSRGVETSEALASTTAGDARAAVAPRASGLATAVGLVVVGLAAFAGMTWMRPRPEAPLQVAPAPPAPPPPSGTTSNDAARVTVRPPWAEVAIDGERRSLEAGELILHGEPGDQFRVVAIDGAARVEQRVSIRKGGLADPPIIDVHAPSTSTSTNPSQPLRPAGPVPAGEANHGQRPRQPAPPTTATPSPPAIATAWK